MNKQQGELFIVSGPSGVGKTTVVTRFLQQSQSKYAIRRVVTYTTKQPRSHDVDGHDYFFINQSEFESKVQSGFFLEWSGAYGACYGTPISILDELALGVSQILIIDRVGAEQIIKNYSQAVLVRIGVSSLSVLFDRLRKRNSESEKQIQARLLLAEKEMRQELVNPIYGYSIENDELNVAIRAFSDVIALYCKKIHMYKKNNW